MPLKSQLIEKDPDAGKDWRQEEKGMTENQIVGWHHWLDGHEFEQALGDGKEQGSLGAAVHGAAELDKIVEQQPLLYCFTFCFTVKHINYGNPLQYSCL